MNLTREEFHAYFPKVSWSTLVTYLGRSEFSHIRRKSDTTQHRYIYSNVTENDILRLKCLIRPKRSAYYAESQAKLEAIRELCKNRLLSEIDNKVINFINQVTDILDNMEIPINDN